jgi:hypothetical protein
MAAWRLTPLVAGAGSNHPRDCARRRRSCGASRSGTDGGLISAPGFALRKGAERFRRRPCLAQKSKEAPRYQSRNLSARGSTYPPSNTSNREPGLAAEPAASLRPASPGREACPGSSEPLSAPAAAFLGSTFDSCPRLLRSRKKLEPSGGRTLRGCYGTSAQRGSLP